MGVLFLFVDGIGLGYPSSENPLSEFSWKGLEMFSKGQSWTQEMKSIQEDEHIFVPIDANIEVEGLPQSGTGQVTLFSGENASKLIAKHFGPYPHSQTKKLISEKSLFKRFIEKGKSVNFLNAYPEIFFQHSEKRGRWSTTTFMAREVGIKLNSINEVRRDEALTAEIKRDYWKKQLYTDIGEIDESRAAEIALEQSSKYDLSLFEYYLTDKAGHTQKMKEAEHALRRLDNFVACVLRNKPDDLSVILTSDHGNIEDLSTKTHTRNPIPFCCIGPAATYFHGITSLTEVTPLLSNAI